MDLQISVRVGDTITHVVCDGNPKSKINKTWKDTWWIFGVGVYLMKLHEGGVFGRWHHECLNVHQKLTRWLSRQNPPEKRWRQSKTCWQNSVFLIQAKEKLSPGEVCCLTWNKWNTFGASFRDKSKEGKASLWKPRRTRPLKTTADKGSV